MIILCRPSPPFLEYCIVEKDFSFKSPFMAQKVLVNDLPERLQHVEKVKGIGYLLYHGGEVVKNPVNFVTGDLLLNIRQKVNMFPEIEGLTVKAIQVLQEKWPDIPHILLCDTAFFT